jgi:hypothetical protein
MFKVLQRQFELMRLLTVASLLARNYADVFGYLVHGIFVGESIGYSVREGRYIVWGYKPHALPNTEKVVDAQEETPVSSHADVAGHPAPSLRLLLAPLHQPGVFLETVAASRKARMAKRARTVQPLRVVSQLPTIQLPAAIHDVWRLVMTCFGDFLVFVEHSGLTRIKLELNRRQSAVLAYLALVAQGTRAAQETILHLFYRQIAPNSYDRDKTDLKGAIRDALEECGARDIHLELVKPIKGHGKGLYKSMQLSEGVVVEIPPHLAFCQQAMTSDPEGQWAMQLPLDTVRSTYEGAMREYQDGLFEHDLRVDLKKRAVEKYWDWAIPRFQAQRTLYLQVLSTCIARERAEGVQAEDVLVRKDCFRRVVLLYEESLRVCATFNPLLEEGEVLWQAYLHICIEHAFRTEPQVTSRDYMKRLKRYGVIWQPKPENRQLWRKAIA